MGDVPRRKPMTYANMDEVEVKVWSDADLKIPEDLSIPKFLQREYDPDKVMPTYVNRYSRFR